MKAFFSIILISTLFLNQSIAQFQFVYPLPGSDDHNPERNIIIREGNLIDRSFFEKANLFAIKGSQSGTHTFQVVLCRDEKTILLNPAVPFTEGETVTVAIHDGIQRVDGKAVSPYTFNFKIQRKYSAAEIIQVKNASQEIQEKEFGKAGLDNAGKKDFDGEDGLPPFNITTNTNPAEGDIFFNNFNFFGVETDHHSIITNNGDSIYSGGGNDRGWDFKLNHNGYLTLFNDGFIPKFEMYDSSYNKVASYGAQNGYITDVHEFQIFPDGHYYLMAHSYQIKDLTIYDSSYNDHATIAGLVVQGFDSDKNFLFEWRSLDHIEVIEAPHEFFTNTTIDYVHGNSIEEDADGNLIISCRHLDQVNKINVSTGEFMWRLGGIKNEFTFINDPEKFTYQHDARRLPNGNITLFDNGNYHTTPISYAKEYKLDEVNKTATLVWSYKHPKVAGANVIGWALGSMQRLDNGNTLINWGYIYPDTKFPNLTEVDVNKNIVWEMRMYNKYDDVIYRAHKYLWNPCARPTPFTMHATDVTDKTAMLKWLQATGAVSYNIQYREVGSTNWITKHASGLVISKKLSQLIPEKTYEWQMQSICANGDASVYSVGKQFTTLPLRLGSDEPANLLNIYPNPATDQITIQLPVEGEDQVEVRLINLFGEVVYDEKFIPLSNGSFEIPVTQVVKGIYYAEVKTMDGRWIGKVVVQ